MSDYTDEELSAIVEGARMREGWEYLPTILSSEDIDLLLDAIRALPQLQAKVEQLQARLARFEGWRDTSTFPRIEQSIPSAVHTEMVEVLAIMPMYHTLIRQGKIDSYWQDDINRLENDRVLGWRYTKEESNHE